MAGLGTPLVLIRLSLDDTRADRLASGKPKEFYGPTFLAALTKAWEWKQARDLALAQENDLTWQIEEWDPTDQQWRFVDWEAAVDRLSQGPAASGTP